MLNFVKASRFVALRPGGGRKVRTPQSSIAGNARRPPRRKGPVQQKASTVRL